MCSFNHIVLLFVIFFFFQAEDGIRDVAVTGVQTCALPISLFLICVAVANVVIVDGHVWDFRDSRRHREAYRATVAAAEALSLLDPDAAGRFWYDENAPRGPIYASIASTRLWGYRLVGARFAAL